MFIAQLALSSPHLLSRDKLQILTTRMETLLQSTTPLDLMCYEDRARFSWSVFLPYVKLVYAPETPTLDPIISSDPTSLLAKLRLLSLELILFWLRNTLGRSCHRDILIQEGLSDYLVCLPWYVPEKLKKAACDLLSVFAGNSSISPPRLSILARAKLAKVRFGLEKVLRVVSARELLL